MGSLQDENDRSEREGCFGVMSVESGLECKKIHLLPCGTNYSGPAPVEDYFKIKAAGSNEDGIAMEEAAFRGRKLMGSRLPLPEGFCGFVLKKDTVSNTENGKIKVKSSKDGFDVWKADSMFGEFSYWNHDALPTKDDNIRTVMEWLPVSAALHEEVTEDDVAVITEKMKSQSGHLAGSKRKL